MPDTVSPEYGAVSSAPPRRRVSLVRWLIGFLILLPVGFIYVNIVRGNYRSFKIISGSMEPTLLVGDYVMLVKQREYYGVDGKIVGFASPDDGELLTKRVLGVEGDHLEVQGGRLYVNGKLDATSDEMLRNVENREWLVGEGELFVVGDNRNDSYDSIDFGPIPIESVLGVINFRYWPYKRISSVTGSP